jgi:hypothetical protein
MANLDKVTITKKDIVVRQCDHCGTKTIHVGKTGNTCIQCIADNRLAGCCSLMQYDRWHNGNDMTTQLAEPKGVKL